MNFYKRHLGDYAKDTGHLTMLEHGAYTLLLDRYYGTEGPIPAAEAYRVCRARSKEEKAAVDVVLGEFFVLKGDAWHSKRADAEIAENQDQSEDRDLRKQNERERQRRHRDERKRLFAELHALDIVPAFDTKTETLRSMLEDAKATAKSPGVTRVVTPPVTRDATANQTPDSRLQSNTPHTPKGAVGLKTWIADVKAKGERPIPETDAVFAYAKEVGIPDEFLHLAWREFLHRYSQPDAKRYKDWRSVFRKAVRGNWLKLWWLDGQHYTLTTAGVQAQRAHQERAA